MKCPHCGNDDKRMMTPAGEYPPNWKRYFCEVCAKYFFGNQIERKEK